MPQTKEPLTREQRRRMAAARAYANLSHLDLGKRMNVSRDTVQRAESGETKFSPHETVAWLQHVAEQCEVPLYFLLGTAPLEAVYAVFDHALAGNSESAITDARRAVGLKAKRENGLAERVDSLEKSVTQLLEAVQGASQIAQAMRGADQDARGRHDEFPEEPEATGSPSP